MRNEVDYGFPLQSFPPTALSFNTFDDAFAASPRPGYPVFMIFSVLRTNLSPSPLRTLTINIWRYFLSENFSEEIFSLLAKMIIMKMKISFPMKRKKWKEKVKENEEECTAKDFLEWAK